MASINDAQAASWQLSNNDVARGVMWVRININVA